MNATAARWVTATPLGAPVEPDVKMIQASSPGPGRPARPDGLAEPASARNVVADRGADAGVVEDLLGARGGVVGVDRHVGGAGG